MARVVGDLWPQASGTSSLGAEQTDGAQGGFTELRPFNHIHMNSGVLHGSLGSSGVLRYNNGRIQKSDNGGLVFVDLVGNLNEAYNGGNIIRNNARLADADVLSTTYRVQPSPVVLGQTIPGAGNSSDYDLLTVQKDSLILASGFSLTPNVRNTYSQTGIGAGFLYLQGSGTADNLPVSLILQANDNNFLSASVSGVLNVDVTADYIEACFNKFCNIVNSLQISTDVGNIDMSSAGSASLYASGPAGLLDLFGQFDVFLHGGDDITISTFPAGRNVLINAGQNVTANVFSLSGSLQYRFGPYQSWAIRTSDTSVGGPANDGFWPIAHSGNILGMIGLQNAYSNGRQIVTAATPGDLIFIANGAKIQFASFNARAPITISGTYTQPNTALTVGDLFMMNHSVVSGIVGVTTDAVARARALGVGSLNLQTNSGVINLRTGSGIAQYLSIGTMPITTAVQIVPFASAYQAADLNYVVGDEATNNSGIITIMSPGLYKVDVKVQAVKLVGTTPQSCRYRLLLNGATLLGDQFNSFHYDTTNGQSQSASLSMIFNADAGDTVSIDANSTLAGANNCSILNRGGVLVIEKIGPKRGQF